MTLILIGTGVAFDLTLSGIDELEKCDESYIETYTNLIEEQKITSLESMIGKKITKLGRNDVESNFLINKAKNISVALLIPGDPLIATTHVSLVVDARNAKIPIKIIHNSSVYTAAAGKAGKATF